MVVYLPNAVNLNVNVYLYDGSKCPSHRSEKAAAVVLCETALTGCTHVTCAMTVRMVQSTDSIRPNNSVIIKLRKWNVQDKFIKF